MTTLEADDERRNLLQRMQHLEKRECTILELRYGLEGERPWSLKEIGRRLGVTREWVRKIEIRALRKLRDDDRDRAIDTKSEDGCRSSGGANRRARISRYSPVADPASQR